MGFDGIRAGDSRPPGSEAILACRTIVPREASIAPRRVPFALVALCLSLAPVSDLPAQERPVRYDLDEVRPALEETRRALELFRGAPLQTEGDAVYGPSRGGSTGVRSGFYTPVDSQRMVA